MKNVSMIAWLLVVVGALNWGLTALGFNLVEMVFGGLGLSKIVYLLVGAAGLWSVWERVSAK